MNVSIVNAFELRISIYSTTVSKTPPKIAPHLRLNRQFEYFRKLWKL